MYQLILDGTNLNACKLHCEIGDLEINYSLLHDETEIKLLFHDIKELKENTVDEEGNIIDTITTYQKRTTQTVTETDNEGNEATKEIEVWEDYDMQPIFDHIDNCIADHDPTPIKPPISENEKIWDVLNYLISN